jgi:hypothetical protein
VQERRAAGHREGDLLICRRARPVLVLKERKTRFVLATRLAGESAAETVAVMMAVFRRLDPRLRASITLDNDPPSPGMACWRVLVPWRPGSATRTRPGRLVITHISDQPQGSL